MISAQQAADISANSLKHSSLHLIWEKIKCAATRGCDCITVDYITETAQQTLKDAGFSLYFDECDRGMSFWVVSWKDAAAKTK